MEFESSSPAPSLGAKPGDGPIYRDAIVTFIDILGFREIVRSRDAKEIGAMVRHFYAVGDVAAYAGSPFGKQSDIGLHVLAFSDSIVRVQSTTLAGALFHELLALVHLQASLAVDGVFLRGGVTRGDIFVEGSTVFGPALVQAYDLESSVALYPRIVIEEKLLRSFVAGELPGHNELPLESGYVQSLLAEADDGYWFLDYLRAYAVELDGPIDYPNYLAAHARSVAQVLAGAGDDQRTRAKLRWLASYHDRVVRELDEQQLSAAGSEKVDLFTAAGSRFAFPTAIPDEVKEFDWWSRRR